MTLPIFSHPHLSEVQLTELLQRLPPSAKGIHLALPTRKVIGARPRQVYPQWPMDLDLAGTLEGRFFWEQGELRWFAAQQFHQGRHQRLLHTVAIGEVFSGFEWQHRNTLVADSQPRMTTYLWPLMRLSGSRDTHGEDAHGLLSVRAPGNAPVTGNSPHFPQWTLTLGSYRIGKTQNLFWRWLSMQKKQEGHNG